MSKRKKAAEASSEEDEPETAAFSDGENELVTPESGQIQSVYVENFMCHKKMTVQLGRHVNFITGQNGSGKSAIVVAIQLCLGSAARTTGRGTNIADYIREGSDGPAVMRVTLVNEGSDAYRPDVFGNRIMVERKIFKAGGRTEYRMFSAAKEEVSREKRELERMLSQFNIHVSNPCCVLTQEDSKKFIQGQESDKYQFFLRATGLARNKENLELVRKQIDESEEKSGPIQENVQQKKEVAGALHKEVQELKQFARLEDEIKLLRAKQLWLDILSREKEIAEINDGIAETENKIRSARDLLIEAEKKKSDEDCLEASQAKIDELTAELGEASEAVEEKKRKVNVMQKDLQKMRTGIKTLKDGITEHSQRAQSVHSEIEQLREKAMQDVNGQEKDLLEKIGKCSREMSINQDSQEGARKEKKLVQDQIQELEDEMKRMASERRQCQNEIQQLQGELDSLSHGGSASGRLSLIHRSVPDIFTRVERQIRLFRGPVLGPIGSLVRIREGFQEYAKALERILGRHFPTFVVTNHEDESTLSGIFREVGCSDSISIIRMLSTERYRIRPVEGAVITVADAISVDSDIVFNFLVDHAHIDQHMLVKTEEECHRQHVVKNNGKYQFKHYPQINCAVTLDGEMIRYVNGNISSDTMKFPFRSILSGDTATVMSQMRQRIEQKTRDLHDINQQFDEAERNRNHEKRRIDILEGRLRECIDAIKKTSKRKQELETALNDIQVAANIDTTELESEESDLRESVVRMTAQLEQLTSEHHAAKNDLAGFIAERDYAEQKKEGLLNRLDAEKRTVEQYLEQREAMRKSTELKQKQLTQLEITLEKATVVRTQQQAALDEKFSKACEETARLVKDWDGLPIPISTNETETRLSAKIKSAQEILERERQKAGLGGRSLEEMLPRYEAAKKELEDAYKDFKALCTNIDMLREDFEARKKAWNKSLIQNAKLVSRTFDAYLQHKGSSGKVEFDHAEKVLRIICQVDNTDGRTRCADVRNLSGGERSFVTLCLLLALGHVIESPFRLMDEYDVFLDEIARKTTIRQLQDYALLPHQLGRQFIIITPHNLNDVVTTNQVRIQRMRPPERSSATGLQQTTL